MTTTAPLASLRARLYEAYASQHAGVVDGREGGDGRTVGRAASALIYRRDIRPVLPPPSAGPVVDIGCGQGELVRLLLADGYDARGIDISPEQVSLAYAAGLDQVRQGDYRDLLGASVGHLAAVTANDLLEHLTKPEVLETFDQVAAALVPGGTFVARVPNAGSPFGGHIRYGDFTHESSYTARSVRQLAAAAGFAAVTVRPCPPAGHGLVSAARVVTWTLISAGYKIALGAETGVIRGHIVTQNLVFVAHRAP